VAFEMKIRKDRHGLYIRGRGYGLENPGPEYRPGDFLGYSHAWNTTDAGLAEGDNPKTAHVNGEPFVKITLTDGSKVYWGSYGRTEGDFAEEK
jgi:hypothetical protein